MGINVTPPPGGSVESVNGETGAVTLDKTDIGLGNVDNTADTAKPVSTAQQTALDAKEAADADLTVIAGLTPSNDDFLQRKSGAWANRTVAQVKTDLALVSDAAYDASWNGDTSTAPSKNAVYDKIETISSSSVSDTAYAGSWDGETAVAPSKNAVYDKIETLQPLDSDLTAIAALSPTNDDIIQRKAGAWTNRTMSQLKTDLALNNVDNTSDATKNAASVTLTNKTISGSANTITNVSLTSGVTGTLPVANGGTGQTARSASISSNTTLSTTSPPIIHVLAASGNVDITLPDPSAGTYNDYDFEIILVQQTASNYCRVLTHGGSELTRLTAVGHYTRASGYTGGWRILLLPLSWITGTADPLYPAAGGTGLTALAQGDIIYGSTSNLFARLTKDTNSTRYLSNQGTSNNPSWSQVNLANGVTGNLAAANGVTGQIVQEVNTVVTAVASGTTQIPYDDTIPQNTEGDQYMSLAITPKNSNNKLEITTVFNFCNSTGAAAIIAALFQDSTANALAAAVSSCASGTAPGQIVFTHYMTAGTTSSTTFKLRAGPSAAQTLTFNGDSGNRKLGGVYASSITIREILV